MSKSKTGRPPVVFSEKEILQVEKMAAVLSKGQLSDFLGVSENTFREIELRQPAVSAAYKRGRAKAIAGVGGGLIQQAMEGVTSASIFYLKTQAGWKETTAVEVTEKVTDDGENKW